MYTKPPIHLNNLCIYELKCMLRLNLYLDYWIYGHKKKKQLKLKCMLRLNLYLDLIIKSLTGKYAIKLKCMLRLNLYLDYTLILANIFPPTVKVYITFKLVFRWRLRLKNNSLIIKKEKIKW